MRNSYSYKPNNNDYQHLTNSTKNQIGQMSTQFFKINKHPVDPDRLIVCPIFSDHLKNTDTFNVWV